MPRYINTDAIWQKTRRRRMLGILRVRLEPRFRPRILAHPQSLVKHVAETRIS